MVYCGKPSKGCGECRARRTRCSEERPSCSQCIRTGRACSGYRDTLSMMFRSENCKVAQQAGKVSSTFAAATSLPNSCNSSTSFSPWPNSPYAFDFPLEAFKGDSPSNQLCLTISPPVGEQAVCFVFYNYVCENTGPDSLNDSFHYLPSIYRNLPPNNFLEGAIIALGLVGIANSTNDSSMMRRARLSYTAAVRAVSRELENVEKAKQDSVLITVLLLGLFETDASDKPTSVSSFMHHINGATSLLKLRGEEQLRTVLGRQLFVQVRSQMIASCIRLRIRVPTEIIEWSRKATQYENPSRAASTQIFLIVTEFCSFRASMSGLHDFSNSPSIVSQALTIDSTLESWAINLPSTYKYSMETIRKFSHEVFSDKYHVYNDIFMAYHWNSYRTIRILLHEIIIEHLIHLSENLVLDHDLRSSYSKQIRYSRTISDELNHEICASVPFYFNFHQQDLHNLWTRPPVKTIAGSFIMWSLYIVAVAGRVNATMREWIVGRLRAVAEVMGVRHASGLAIICGKRREVADWEGLDADEDTFEGNWCRYTRELVVGE